jgi:hypothetical protein
MFCGRASYLDEFCFQRKRIQRRRVDYARDSYRNEFIDFLPRSYSHDPPHFYSRASPRTFSRALPRTSSSASPQFAYNPRPHHGDHFPCRPGFPTGGSFPHFKLRHLDGPRFPHRGSRLTRPSGEVQRMVKTSSGRMIKY